MISTTKGGARSGGRGGAGGPKNGPKTPKTPQGPVRDETDTFIDEVTEELRRDRLYAMFRRYGPYLLAAIVLVVAGAAVNEYRKAQRTETARAIGGALLEAEQADEKAAAYLSVAASAEPGAAMIARFNAAALRAEEGDLQTAASIYRSVAVDPNLAPRFRDLALLKAAMAEADIADPQSLIQTLAPIAAEGAPYRPLALELQAAAFLRLGDETSARQALIEAIASPGAPRNLIGRANEVLAALGPAAGAASENEASDGAADSPAPTD